MLAYLQIALNMGYKYLSLNDTTPEFSSTYDG